MKSGSRRCAPNCAGVSEAPRVVWAMILVIDNHDSFTWNLVHYLRELGAKVRVETSDRISVDEAMADAAGILVSPGPGQPDAAGISLALIGACAEARRPLLGVCLGHQAIGAAFGGRIERAPRAMHGKTSLIGHDGDGLFAGLPSSFVAARYHSLVIAPASLPDCLQVTARAEDGTIQGVRHRSVPIAGVQFHPESIASEHGHAILRNWLSSVNGG
jgi:anthranilate synthase component II